MNDDCSVFCLRMGAPTPHLVIYRNCAKIRTRITRKNSNIFNAPRNGKKKKTECISSELEMVPVLCVNGQKHS